MSVMITNEEYEVFKEARFWQLALEQAGVDNWEGFDEACTIYHDISAASENPVMVAAPTENLAEDREDPDEVVELPEYVTLKTQQMLAIVDALDMLSATVEYATMQAATLEGFGGH